MKLFQFIRTLAIIDLSPPRPTAASHTHKSGNTQTVLDSRTLKPLQLHIIHDRNPQLFYNALDTDAVSVSHLKSSSKLFLGTLMIAVADYCHGEPVCFWPSLRSLSYMLFKNATQASIVVPRWNHKGLSVATLTALWRSVALNSSPMVLSWMATLLTLGCNVPSSGTLGWDESLDRCSVCGSRSGRGPCLWLRSCCVLWSKPTAERPKSVNKTESGIPSLYLNRFSSSCLILG